MPEHETDGAMLARLGGEEIEKAARAFRESVMDALREENARLTRERDDWEKNARSSQARAMALMDRAESMEQERDANAAECRRLVVEYSAERDALRARVEELERECDRLRSGVRDIAREFGMYETDDRTAGEAFSMAHALLFGGSREPRPDVSPLHAAALRSRARAGLASPEPRPDTDETCPACEPMRDTSGRIRWTCPGCGGSGRRPDTKETKT